MSDAAPAASAPRPGRCAHHPGIPQAEACGRCGAPLCVACAVPVRGTPVGPECLADVLPGVPEEPAPPPGRRRPAADLLPVLGFGALVLLSALPWSRFGDASGPFLAWRLHWSLPAVAAGAAGLAVAVIGGRRPTGLPGEAWVLLALAAIAVVASLLHFDRPPPLSSPTPVPLLAVVAAGAAGIGAALKVREGARRRRPV